MTKELKAVSLKNFKGLAKVDIEITSPNFHIVGPNGSGKTTILQAIWLAIEGKYGFESKKKDRFQFIKPDSGAKAASTMVKIYDSEIDQIVTVERRFTAKTETVKISREDGKPIDISYLEGMLDYFTYDIQRFASMAPVEQARLFGIDVGDIDDKIKSAKKLLSDCNKKKLEMMAAQRQRSSDFLESAQEIIPEFDTDDEIARVDTAELQGKISEIFAHNEQQRARERALTESQERIQALQADLEMEKKRFSALEEPKPLINQLEIEGEINRAEAVNKLVDRQEENKKFLASVDAAVEAWNAARENVESLTDQRVERIRACKDDIENAGIPSDNIDFDEKGGLLVDGRYLNEDNYSTGELIKKAIIIINAFKKPEFPLFLIRNGSLLNRNKDGEIQILNDLEGLGAQFICEIVADEPAKNGILLTEDLKK